MKIFSQATLYEKIRFLPFISKFHKKMGEFAASIERSKALHAPLSCTTLLARGYVHY